jgi:hypothetical protein
MRLNYARAKVAATVQINLTPPMAAPPDCGRVCFEFFNKKILTID